MNHHRIVRCAIFCGVSPLVVHVAHPAERLEEIVVTGSCVIRDGFTSPTPVTVLDEDYLNNLSIVSVGDAVAQLPQNTAMCHRRR